MKQEARRGVIVCTLFFSLSTHVIHDIECSYYTIFMIMGSVPYTIDNIVQLIVYDMVHDDDAPTTHYFPFLFQQIPMPYVFNLYRRQIHY
jgi:hypothetical protein